MISEGKLDAPAVCAYIACVCDCIWLLQKLLCKISVLGVAQVINRGDVGNYGTMFKIVFETTKTYTNQRSCFVINGTSDGKVTPQGVFPDLSNYIVSCYDQVLWLYEQLCH